MIGKENNQYSRSKIVHNNNNNNYVVKLISANEKFPNVHKEQHTVVTEYN